MLALWPKAGQVGFGTANLYAGSERARSVALVRAAIDAGIRWFDTAPLYGHGAAEAIVGEAIAGCRNDLILVSKVGILPSQITTGYKIHARMAALAAKIPGARAVLPPPPPRRPKFNVFAPADVLTSVERSLKSLGTDRLDFLLLHEVDPATAVDPALLAMLDGMVRDGKLLGFGTATQPDKTLQIAASPEAARFALFQVPASGSEALRVPDGAHIVLHSVLGERLKTVLARLKSDRDLRDTARRLAIDPDQPDLGRRLVAYALRRNEVCTVLFSTSDPVRISAMADAAGLAADEAEAGMKLVTGEKAHG